MGPEIKKSENHWEERDELGLLLIGWKEIQRPKESEYVKEAREAEIREISGTEEMMPAVSYQTPVADTWPSCRSPLGCSLPKQPVLAPWTCHTYP